MVVAADKVTAFIGKDVVSKSSPIDDVLQMIQILQADVKYGPYHLILPAITPGLTASTDRRWIRRQARRFGITFYTKPGRPRLYVLRFEIDVANALEDNND